MNNEEPYYSLCVTICYKNGYTELLRLADISISIENSGKTGQLFLPFDNTSDLPYVKKISMDKKEANLNELSIWEWYLQLQNPDKQQSYHSPMTFYELIFLNNIDLNNGLTINSLPIWDLFDILLDGFIVPLQHSKSFLLVINQTKTEYICLDITESSYSCNGNKIKIHENTLLKEYKIPKSDVIDTNEYIPNLGVSKYSLEPAFQRRIIYKRRIIWAKPVATLPLKRFNTHLAGYLEQVMTRLPGRIGDKIVIEALIKSITEDVKPDSDLMTFFEEYYSQPNEDSLVPTLEKYGQLESVFTSYIKRKSTDEKFLKFIVEHLPSLRAKYLQILTEGYLEEEKKKLMNRLIPLQTQIEELNSSLKAKNTQTEELDAKILSLTNSQTKLLALIKESEQRRRELDELLNGSRTGLLQELSTLRKVLLLGETNFESSTQNTNTSALTIRLGHTLEYEKEPIEITNLSGMYSHLLDNLPEQGANTPDLLDLSKFVSASYLCHLPLLCVGTYAGDMARIISISLNNQLPDAICVPTGYNNYSSLLSTIRNLKSDIVVLENVVGYCDEYCYTHLAEDIPEKYIIFLVEYEETLKLLPKGIYAHMGLIYCDKFFSMYLMSDEKPYPGEISGLISYSPDIATSRKLFSKISNLTRGSAVSIGYVNSRLRVLQAFTENGDNVAEVLKIIYTELISINEIYGLTEEYINRHLDSTDPVVKNFIEKLGVETE